MNNFLHKFIILVLFSININTDAFSFKSYKNRSFTEIQDQANKNNQNFTIIFPDKIATPSSIEDLQNIVKQANQKDQKISIKGMGKSQGGQICDKDSIMINMKDINKIIALDIENKQITCQAGITWSELQKAINFHRLSIASMQSYSDFSVGGSISVNAHGQDFNSGTISDTIISLKIMLYNGSVITLSRKENLELFNLVIGGYGLFGIITQATLKLTDDILLIRDSKLIKLEDYQKYFFNNVNNNETDFHSARLSVSPNNFFKEVLSITYKKHKKLTEQSTLYEPKNINIKKDQILFNLLRKYSFAKRLRFYIEQFIEKKEVVSRNNHMHCTIDHLGNGFKDTYDFLQEYFIPSKNLIQFINQLKDILLKNQVNILNATIRYVKKAENIFLNYAPNDCFAIVLYINSKNTSFRYEEAQKWTQLIIDKAIQLDGTYYLPYQLFATKDQLTKAYPQFNEFIKFKKKYDPNEIFINKFYKIYA